MNEREDTAPMTPQDALREAVDAENADLIQHLRERCARLRAELILRDARIVELEAERLTATRKERAS